MLKIINVSPLGLAVKSNLRLTHKVTSEVNFSIHDVEWCVKDTSRALLACGASNGNIILWDISNRDGRPSQERVIAAHPRTVNRINWHPQEEGLLLSASQDTYIKLWDRRGRLYHCQATYQPRAEAVRDVQWHPSKPDYFAAACESGSVQLWDRRQGQGPVQKLMGHSGLVLALEWHLTEPWILATGARDRTVKVWDLSDQSTGNAVSEGGAGGGQEAGGGVGRGGMNGGRSKVLCLINTVSAVNRIKWRPRYPKQVATTSSVQGDNTIHVWDVDRPYLPLATFEGHEDVCGSFVWLDTPSLPEWGSHADSAHGEDGAGEGAGNGSSHPSPGAQRQVQQQQQHEQLSRRPRPSGFFGNWGAVWGETFSQSKGQRAGLQEEMDGWTCLGVWRHLISCARDGRVILHSLAQASRPHDTLTPSVVSLSVRGELLTSHERVDRSGAFLGLHGGKRRAQGLFDEEEGGGHPAGAQAEGKQGMDKDAGGRGKSTLQQPPNVRADAGRTSPSHPRRPLYTPSPLSTPFPSIPAAPPQPSKSVLQAPNIPSPSGARSADERPSPFPATGGDGGPGHGFGAGASVANKVFDVDDSCWRPRFLYRMEWDEDSEHTLAVARAIEGLSLLPDGRPGRMEKNKMDGKPKRHRVGRRLKGNGTESQVKPMQNDSVPSSSVSSSSHFADRIARLGKRYVLRPRGCLLPLQSVGTCCRAREDLCHYNAEVARLEGQWRMAHVWEMLGVILSGPGVGGKEGRGVSEDEDTGINFATGTHGHPMMDKEDSKGKRSGRKETRDKLSQEACMVGAVSTTSFPSVLLHGPLDTPTTSSTCLQLLRREILGHVVEELLEEGELQNCVALFEVIQSTGKALPGESLSDLIGFRPERVREIYVGYLELLQRLTLWEVANELVEHLEDRYIHGLYASNTNIYAACAQCRRPLGPGSGGTKGVMSASSPGSATSSSTPTPSPWCGKCRALVSQCALCLQPVRGVYVWCPGCGHGGHIDHLQEWFAANSECPTGCGHRCHHGGK